MKTLLLVLAWFPVSYSADLAASQMVSDRGKISTYSGEIPISTLKVNDLVCATYGSPCAYVLPGITVNSEIRNLVNEETGEKSLGSARVASVTGKDLEQGCSAEVDVVIEGSTLVAKISHYCYSATNRKSLTWALKALPATVTYQLDATSTGGKNLKEVGKIVTDLVTLKALKAADFKCNAGYLGNGTCTYEVTSFRWNGKVRSIRNPKTGEEISYTNNASQSATWTNAKGQKCWATIGVIRGGDNNVVATINQSCGEIYNGNIDPTDALANLPALSFYVDSVE